MKEYFFESEYFLHPVFAYHIGILCLIAYYADEVLSDEEISYILNSMDKYLEADIPDRELVKKEILVAILEFIENSKEYTEMKGRKDRFKAALTFADEFSHLMHLEMQEQLLAEKGIDGKKDLNYILDKMISEYEGLAKANHEVTKEERKIVDTVRLRSQKPSVGQKIIMSLVVVAVIVALYKLIRYLVFT